MAETAQDIATRWQQEVTRYEKWTSDWRRKCEKLLKLYQRQQSLAGQRRRFAMLWANTEILKPAIYARSPVSQISRRYRDQDKVGRVASELLERCANYALEKADLDSALKHVRDDVLLPGRGTVWLRVNVSQPALQSIAVDYVHWKDFMHSPARIWEEVTWVGKWSYLTAAEVAERFGKEMADELPLDHKPSGESGGGLADDPTKGIRPKAAIAEIWDKTRKQVLFISKSHPTPLEVSEPFLDLERFWPCPKPVYATLTNETLIPSPDYVYYRDQAEEIDDLTGRIASLTDSLKVVGFYPAGSDTDIQQAIERALNPGVENKMIPVESWAAFAERGGQSIIVFLPIKEVAETIRACIELRTQLINDVYQISGIADIMRGSSDPNETLGAQQLKSQWGSIRIRDRQQLMAEFARDITRIACEIMAEQFDFQALREMANMMPQPVQPQAPMMPTPEMGAGIEGGAPPMQAAPPGPSASGASFDESVMPQVEQLLRNERLRGFRVDIETDSTIQPDEDQEKQRRVEFTEAISMFMEKALPAAQMQPALLPMLGEMLLFMVRGFRAGRTMEDVIERTMAQLEQAAQQPAQDPQAEAMKAKIEMEKEKAGIQMQSMQGKMAIEQQKGEMDLGMKQAEMGLKHEEMDMKRQQFGQEQQMDKQRFLQEAQQNAAAHMSNMQQQRMKAMMPNGGGRR